MMKKLLGLLLRQRNPVLGQPGLDRSIQKTLLQEQKRLDRELGVMAGCFPEEGNTR